MNFKLLTVACFMLSLAYSVDAQACGTCNRSGCKKVQCNFGVVLDKCKCCEECARGLKQTCGGRANVGTCAKLLECRVNSTNSAEPGICVMDTNADTDGSFSEIEKKVDQGIPAFGKYFIEFLKLLYPK